MTMLLSVQELVKTYHRDQVPVLALDHVRLDLELGCFAGISGPSGSGKSTLLAVLAGLLPADKGQVIFNGLELTSLNDKERSLLRNRDIGYIPQGHSILANFSVLENVCLPVYLTSANADPTPRAIDLLGRLGVAHLAEQRPAQLSGGELRRVSIARGLIQKPKLLLADEPTGDLDQENADNVMALFRDIASQGIAVLLVTHDQYQTYGFDRVLYMQDGILNPAY